MMQRSMSAGAPDASSAAKKGRHGPALSTQHSIAQHSTAQRSAAQHSAAQRSAAQHSVPHPSQEELTP